MENGVGGNLATSGPQQSRSCRKAHVFRNPLHIGETRLLTCNRPPPRCPPWRTPRPVMRGQLERVLQGELELACRRKSAVNQPEGRWCSYRYCRGRIGSNIACIE